MFPTTKMENYFGVNFEQDALPALMLVKGHEQKVVFYENIEFLTEDQLAVWLYDNVFQDLAQIKRRTAVQKQAVIQTEEL